MRLFRYIPPAGTVIRFRELVGWAIDTLSGKDRRPELCDAIRERFGVKHCFLMSSGRAAMALIFQVLKNRNEDPERVEIVIPSYTCYSVPAAAEISGLQVRICDIDPQTLSYDMDQFSSIDLSRVLCVVTANLYGHPNNLPELEKLAHQGGCYLLDDAAQSMNARIDDRYAGTYGDIGLYSLDKGKNITSIQGGIIVTSNEVVAGWLENEISQLTAPSWKQQLSDTVKLFIYVLMLKPWLYWIPANIPATGLGKTIYTTNYLFSQYSRSLSSLALRLFMRLDEITESRRAKCTQIMEAVDTPRILNFIRQINENTHPACLRLPVLIKNSKLRNKIINKLNKKGIGATASYPESIADLPETSRFCRIHNEKASGGQYVADHIMTLPSISYLSQADVDVIVSVINDFSS